MPSFTHRAKVRHPSAVLLNRYLCINTASLKMVRQFTYFELHNERRHSRMVAQRKGFTGWRGNNYRSWCVVTAVLPLCPLVPRVTEGSCPLVQLEGTENSRITSAMPHHETH